MNIVIYGYYGELNTGDELILEVLGEYLTKLCLNHHAKISVLPTLQADVQYNPRAGGIRVASYVNCKALARLGVFTGAARTDLLIIGGGGLIQDHEDNGTGPIRSLLKRGLLVRLLGGKVVMLGVGVSPLTSTAGRLETRLLCSLCDLIMTRDAESAEVLANIGIPNKKVSITGDLVFLWRPSETIKPRSHALEAKNRRLVVSLLPYHRECNESREKTERVRTGFATALDDFLSESTGSVTFLSFQGKPVGYDQEEAEAVMNLMSMKEFCSVKPYDDNPVNVYQEIIDADLVVGMRLHSVVLSFLAGVPFVAVSYHPKVTSFAKITGMSQRMITRDEISRGELTRKIRSVYKERNFCEMTNRLPELREAAQLNFTLLKDCYFRH